MAKVDSGFGFIPANMVVGVGEEARQERKREFIPITMTQCPNKLWEIDARGKTLFEMLTAFPTVIISCLHYSESIQKRFGLKGFVSNMVVNLISGLASSLNSILKEHGDGFGVSERKLMDGVLDAFYEFVESTKHDSSYSVSIEKAGGPNV